MTVFNVIFLFSIFGNIFLLWYLIRILRKFVFVSENIADLYLTTKAFQVFVRTLYSMDSYHGEPMIGELILRLKEVNLEIDNFRDIFEHTLDEELEDELDAAEEASSNQIKIN
tara:strand:- start:435 stop:773 length:339 start_codon:yes stop_codon:yes gene_type:complete